MKKGINRFLNCIIVGLICGSTWIGLSGFSFGNNSKIFEMCGVKFTADLTRKELKKAIAGKDPDTDEKNEVTYKNIDGIEDVNGDLVVYFRSNGKFSSLLYELKDKSQYNELKKELVSKYGEPKHNENVNDMRKTTWNYWRISDDTVLQMYRGTGFGGQWYNTYIQVYNLTEKEQTNKERQEEKYTILQDNLKTKKYNKAFKTVLSVIDWTGKPFDKIMDKYDLVYQPDQYNLSPMMYDFEGGKVSLLGDTYKLNVSVNNPNSKYKKDEEDGEIKGVSLELINGKELGKKDKKYFNKFKPIFGNWTWDDKYSDAKYDNGLFTTTIGSNGSIYIRLGNYYTVDTQYIHISKSNKKHAAYDTVDITPYLTRSNTSSDTTNGSSFDSNGRTSSSQTSDIIGAIQNMSNKNQFGWSISNKTEFDNDNYHCTNFDVFLNDTDTNLDLVVRADKNNGQFKGLTYYSTEKNKAPNIDTDNLAKSYQAIILYTDATLPITDESVYDGALQGGITKNGRTYKISVEDGYIMLDITV